jgi:hypothetical protein
MHWPSLVGHSDKADQGKPSMNGLSAQKLSSKSRRHAQPLLDRHAHNAKHQ